MVSLTPNSNIVSSSDRRPVTLRRYWRAGSRTASSTSARAARCITLSIGKPGEDVPGCIAALGLYILGASCMDSDTTPAYTGRAESYFTVGNVWPFDLC
jgi:hypothetical protein